MTKEEPAHQTATLERTLGLRDLILLIIGTVIGSGIFIVPGAVLRQVQGGVGLAMLVWLVGGILSLLGAMTYGELAARSAKAGGIYIYIRDCFSPLLAFLYGWTLFLVISTGAIATLAVASSAYLGGARRCPSRCACLFDLAFTERESRALRTNAPPSLADETRIQCSRGLPSSMLNQEFI